MISWPFSISVKVCGLYQFLGVGSPSFIRPQPRRALDATQQQFRQQDEQRRVQFTIGRFILTEFRQNVFAICPRNERMLMGMARPFFHFQSEYVFFRENNLASG